MLNSLKLLTLLALVAVTTSTCLSSEAFAQDDSKLARMAIQQDGDGMVIRGDCEWKLGGRVCIVNRTRTPVGVFVCIDGQQRLLGVLKPGGRKYFDVPNDPALAGLTIKLKAVSRRLGRASKDVTLVP